VLLTRDGVEHNRIRYRDREIVTRLLDNMAHTQAKRGQRKDGSITFEVKARITPGNLDTIQIHDIVADEWVIVPSTQPHYTGNLSEWEHQEFTRQAAKRNEPFSSEKQRLASKMRTMRLIDEKAPSLAFQQRRQMATLYQSQQVQKLAGRKFSVPEGLDEASLARQESIEANRADAGVRVGANARPPVRPEGYGGGVFDPDITVIDWDDVYIDHNNDAGNESDQGEAA